MPLPLKYRYSHSTSTLSPAVTGFSKDSRKRRFLRGKAKGKEVWLPDQQANGQMRSMVGCNGLIEIPAGSGPVKAGDKVEVLWL